MTAYMEHKNLANETIDAARAGEIAGNVHAVLDRVAAAEQAAGRKEGSVRLLAATKTRDVGEIMAAIDAGIQGAMLSGVLAGYPVVDVKVTLYDGSYHEVDSSEMAFKIAGSMAFKEAMRKADPTLLEPIMKVCVIVPDEYMGDVIGDLNARRGQIQGYEMRSGAQQIDAFVPLAEMFGYATDLRSRTQGRGQYTMEPSHYIELPKGLQEKLIAKRTGRENF